MQIWIGNGYIIFTQASSFHPIFGPLLVTVFAVFSNTLLVTSEYNESSRNQKRVEFGATPTHPELRSLSQPCSFFTLLAFDFRSYLHTHGNCSVQQSSFPFYPTRLLGSGPTRLKRYDWPSFTEGACFVLFLDCSLFLISVPLPIRDLNHRRVRPLSFPPEKLGLN